MRSSQSLDSGDFPTSTNAGLAVKWIVSTEMFPWIVSNGNVLTEPEGSCQLIVANPGWGDGWQLGRSYWLGEVRLGIGWLSQRIA